MPPIRDHTTLDTVDDDDDMPPLVDNPNPSMTYTFFVTPADSSSSSQQPAAHDRSPDSWTSFASTPPQSPHLADVSSSTMSSSSLAAPPRGSHGKKRDASYIPRPPNAFILFRSSFIRSQQVPGKVEGNHSTLSKIIGMYWKSLPRDEREKWEAKAVVAQAEHRKRYPDWRFRPGANALAKSKQKVKDGTDGEMGEAGPGPGTAARRRSARIKVGVEKDKDATRTDVDMDRDDGEGDGADIGSPELEEGDGVYVSGKGKGKAKPRQRANAESGSVDSRDAGDTGIGKSSAAETRRSGEAGWVAKIAGLLVEGKKGAELEVAVNEWEGTLESELAEEDSGGRNMGRVRGLGKGWRRGRGKWRGPLMARTPLPLGNAKGNSSEEAGGANTGEETIERIERDDHTRQPEAMGFASEQGEHVLARPDIVDATKQQFSAPPPRSQLRQQQRQPQEKDGTEHSVGSEQMGYSLGIRKTASLPMENSEFYQGQPPQPHTRQLSWQQTHFDVQTPYQEFWWTQEAQLSDREGQGLYEQYVQHQRLGDAGRKGVSHESGTLTTEGMGYEDTTVSGEVEEIGGYEEREREYMEQYHNAILTHPTDGSHLVTWSPASSGSDRGATVAAGGDGELQGLVAVIEDPYLHDVFPYYQREHAQPQPDQQGHQEEQHHTAKPTHPPPLPIPASPHSFSPHDSHPISPQDGSNDGMSANSYGYAYGQPLEAAPPPPSSFSTLSGWAGESGPSFVGGSHVPKFRPAVEESVGAWTNQSSYVSRGWGESLVVAGDGINEEWGRGGGKSVSFVEHERGEAYNHGRKDFASGGGSGYGRDVFSVGRSAFDQREEDEAEEEVGPTTSMGWR